MNSSNLSARVGASESGNFVGDLGLTNHDLRNFRLGVDVRSFKTTMRLPMRAANVYVRVMLPQLLTDLGPPIKGSGNVSKLLAPHRTHPPTLVHRGTEVTIPNGYLALELPAYATRLASALSQKPELTAQVFHSDAFKTDVLLGVALIPLEQLIREPSLDGLAAVLRGHNPQKHDSDQCIIGVLRVVLSLEDLGPILDKFQKTSNSLMHTAATVSANSKMDDGNIVLRQDENEKKDFDHDKDAKDFVASAANRCQNEYSDGGIKGKQSCANGNNPCTRLESHPAFELAWEFEMWKRSEEAKWRQDLQQKESKVLSELEANWFQKQSETIDQINIVREENLNLEQKLRSKLCQLEKREKALLLVEEQLSLEKDTLDKHYQQHISETQGIMKGLRAECEQKLEIGQLKYTALEAQYKVLEKRFASTSTALMKLEKEFSEMKSAYRNTSEAYLTAEVVCLQTKCSDLQEKVDCLQQTRKKYKEQISRLVKELASLHHLKFQTQFKKLEDQHQGNDVQYVAAMVEEHTRRAQEERHELQELKRQLQDLELATLTTRNAFQQPASDFGICGSPLPAEKEIMSVGNYPHSKEGLMASCSNQKPRSSSPDLTNDVTFSDSLAVSAHDDKSINLEFSPRGAEAQKTNHT